MSLPFVLPSRLLESLAEADARFPTERKLLVCRDHGEGRELLRALALWKGGWIGWEAATLRDIAGEMALATLSDRGLRRVEDIEHAAIVDTALDRVVEERGDLGFFGPLAEGRGFRRAIADSIEALRLAQVEATSLRRTGDPKLTELGDVLDEYEAELRRRRGADSADVFLTALETFELERRLFGARLFLVPGLGRRALSGRLVERLRASGAVTLVIDTAEGHETPEGLLPPSTPEAFERSLEGSSSEPPEKASQRFSDTSQTDQLDLLAALDPSAPCDGHRFRRPRPSIPQSFPKWSVPTCLAWLAAPARIPLAVDPIQIDFFRASSPAAEVREVLRRVLERGLAWDQVEIVTPDPLTYGCALDGLAAGLGIEVTYAVGLPLERSRVGRLVHAFLDWLDHGLQARLLWEALSRGDLRPPEVEGDRPSGTGVSRELRRLRIGWGRSRYLDARRRLRKELDAPPPPNKDEDADPADVDERWRRRRLELIALDRLLEELVKAVPAELGEALPSPDRDRVRVSASRLARSLLDVLALFPPRGEAEREALRRVRETLEQVSEVCVRDVPLPLALAELRGHLAIRIPSPRTLGRQPWSSSAGRLHLSDVRHGGRSGRPFSFLVGLDADRTVPARAQDPILLDADRRRLGGGLPTTADRMAEERYSLAVLLAGLRGCVTLSYAGWDASDGSLLAPSPILLQALRARERDPRIGFEPVEGGPLALTEIVGDPVSPVPVGERAIDRTDILLRALSRGSLMLDGEELVRSVFPRLAAGLASRDARRGSVLTSHHGIVPEARDLDPREQPNGVISVSAIEMLARCPLAWFYRHALKLREPEDPEYDPARWLSPGERGTLLHGVFERFGTLYRGRQGELDDPEATTTLVAITKQELERWLERIPAPSAAALVTEREEILGSALAFLEMERLSRDGTWEAFELEFGMGDAPAAAIRLPDGRGLRVRGRIDRVDRLARRELRVIDYKTGRAGYYEKKPGEPPFAGGRRIQAGVYAGVVESLYEEPVHRFEYRFPTTSGEHGTVPYERWELEGASGIVAALLDMIARGWFVATDDPADCGFCAFREICRVTGRGEDTESPPASWSRGHEEDLEEYATLRRLRTGG